MKYVVLVVIALVGACGSDTDSIKGDAGGTGEDAGEDGSDSGTTQKNLRFTDRGRVFEPTVLFEGTQVNVPASDPSAMLEGSQIRMAYTCVDFAVEPPATQICEIVSEDGRTWTEDRVVLKGGVRESRYAYEGSELVAHEGSKTLLASWYPAPEHASVAYGFPATLAAHSEAVMGYDYLQDVLSPEPGPDADAVYSPAVEATEDGYVMVYAATCYPRAGVDCGGSQGVSLGWARSSDSAESWERIEAPELQGSAGWTGIMVAEPELLHVKDRWFLFLTGFEFIDGGEKPTAIGYATSDSADGPFELHPEPILTAKDVGARYVVAPTAVFHEGEILLWYTWLGDDELQRIALTVGTFE
jgi:hypothetical protein